MTESPAPGSDRSPGQEPRQHYLLLFFGGEHLPPALQEHSRPFAELAQRLIETLPDNPERSVALRKLIEAKDCAVRAALLDGLAPLHSPHRIGW
jgi:hypothetical protein